jgi:hypothetical protein
MLRSFANLRLGYKLLIPLALLVVTTGAILWTAQNGLSELRSATTVLMESDVARRTLLLTAVADLNDAAIQEKTIAGSEDNATASVIGERYGVKIAGALGAADQLIALSPTPERRATNQTFKDLLLYYKQVADKSIALSLKNDKEGADRLSSGEVVTARKKAAAFADERGRALTEEMRNAQTNLVSLGDSVLMRLYTFAGVGLGLSLSLLAAIVMCLVIRPLAAMVGAMKRLAMGDLTVEVKGTAQRRGRFAGTVPSSV